MLLSKNPRLTAFTMHWYLLGAPAPDVIFLNPNVCRLPLWPPLTAGQPFSANSPMGAAILTRRHLALHGGFPTAAANLRATAPARR